MHDASQLADRRADKTDGPDPRAPGTARVPGDLRQDWQLMTLTPVDHELPTARSDHTATASTRLTAGVILDTRRMT